MRVLEPVSAQGKSAGLDGSNPAKPRDERKQDKNSRDSTKQWQAPLVLENTLKLR